MMGSFSAFMASVTWAIGSSTYGLLAKRYVAYTLNFTRAIIALPLFFIVLIFQEGGIAQAFQSIGAANTSTLAWLFASMLASYGLGDFFFFWSTKTLGVPRALAIASSYPLFSATAGWMFMGQPLSVWRGLGLVMTVVGVVLVILSETHAIPPGHPHPAERDSAKSRSPLQKGYWLGVFYAFLVSGFWALNTFSISQVSGQITAVAASTIRMMMTLPLCLIYSLALRKQGRDLLIGRSDFRSYGWVFALESFGGSLFFVYGLTHAPLAIASALSGLAPVLTVPLAVLSGQEKFRWKLVIGILLTALGAWILVAAP